MILEIQYIVNPSRWKLLFMLLPLAICGLAQENGLINIPSDDYKIIELKADTLPPLNIPRAGHHALCLDGQMTVFGGHTEGFVPTPTAEYFKDGRWHTIPLTYPHDHAVAMPLRSGQVFLSGGHRDPLGIGHLFAAEIYDPKNNTSNGFGCMDLKRAFHNALEMADGQVYISGNWFESDCIEVFGDIYDPYCTNAVEVKEVSFGRAHPYILRISDDDAIVFSSLSNTFEPVDFAVIDRIKGESYKEPFLNTWTPIRTLEVRRSYNQFIGNESEGIYEWLIPVENDSTRQVAIARVKGITENNSKPTFSLQPLTQPLPYSYEGEQIIYSSLVCDTNREIAYLIGNDKELNIFIVVFPYNSPEPSTIIIFKTQPQPIRAQTITPMLTPDGDLVFAGGRRINNFDVSDAVIRIPLGQFYGASTNGKTKKDASSILNLWWLWILIICFVIGTFLTALYFKRRKKLIPNIPLISADTQQLSDSSNVSDEVDNVSNGSEDYNPSEGKAQKADDGSTLGNEVCGEIDQAQSQTQENNGVQPQGNVPEITSDKYMPKDEVLIDLYKRIEELMQQEQLYLNPNLRASDIAVRVNTNTGYVSSAINSQCGCSLTQYLTGYRIAYAQKIMREDPQGKLSSVSALSGFSTESTFFRAFRTITGMSPKEWLAENREKEK